MLTTKQSLLDAIETAPDDVLEDLLGILKSRLQPRPNPQRRKALDELQKICQEEDYVMTIEEMKAAIATSDESDATYTDGSTLEELKASQVNPPKPKFDHAEKFPQGVPDIDFDDDILYFYTDGSSAADIIANGKAPSPKPKPEKK